MLTKSINKYIISLCILKQRKDEFMNVEELSLKELKDGYKWQAEINAWVCLSCGEQFEKGEIFSFEGRFFEAERAAEIHVDAQHDQMEHLMISKYNTLTDNQQQLLEKFQSGKTDKEIAKELGLSPSTIRHQKFTFREKAKQAKVYLAIYEQMVANKGKRDDDLIKIHEGAKQVDNRYHITENEKEQILKTTLISREPLVLKVFPKKEKRKIIVLMEIVNQFQANKKYSEAALNQILKSNFDDFVTLRRYLIEYGFMDRTADGSEYWLKSG